MSDTTSQAPFGDILPGCGHYHVHYTRKGGHIEETSMYRSRQLATGAAERVVAREATNADTMTRFHHHVVADRGATVAMLVYCRDCSCIEDADDDEIVPSIADVPYRDEPGY